MEEIIKIQAFVNIIILRAIKIQIYLYYHFGHKQFDKIPEYFKKHFQSDQMNNFVLGHKTAYSKEKYLQKKDELIYPLPTFESIVKYQIERVKLESRYIIDFLNKNKKIYKGTPFEEAFEINLDIAKSSIENISLISFEDYTGIKNGAKTLEEIINKKPPNDIFSILLNLYEGKALLNLQYFGEIIYFIELKDRIGNNKDSLDEFASANPDLIFNLGLKFIEKADEYVVNSKNEYSFNISLTKLYSALPYFEAADNFFRSAIIGFEKSNNIEKINDCKAEAYSAEEFSSNILTSLATFGTLSWFGILSELNNLEILKRTPEEIKSYIEFAFNSRPEMPSFMYQSFIRMLENPPFNQIDEYKSFYKDNEHRIVLAINNIFLDHVELINNELNSSAGYMAEINNQTIINAFGAYLDDTEKEDKLIYENKNNLEESICLKCTNHKKKVCAVCKYPQKYSLITQCRYFISN